MTCSKVLSNYDKETIKKLKESKLLIIDLDGTLINFENIDNMIISTIFKESKIIASIDNLLWKINRLDILGNGYAALKLRLAIYSLFTKGKLSKAKENYEKLYKQYGKIEFDKALEYSVIPLLKKGYHIAIVTKNAYAREFLYEALESLDYDVKENMSIIILKRGKKKQEFGKFVKKFNKACIIGNNLSDDILNSHKMNLPYVYIGKSKLVKYIVNFSKKYNSKKGIVVDEISKINDIFLED